MCRLPSGFTTVIDFQKNHRSRLATYWREKNAKNSTILDDAKRKMVNQFKELERYNQQLQEENNKLRSLVAGGPGSGGGVRRHGGTPGRTLQTASSPAAHHALRVAQGHSPQQMRTSSPYGRRQSTPGPGGDACSTPQQVRSTPPGPARLSIRTPPVNGRIGTVTTPTSSSNSLSLTPHGSLQLVRSNVKTPGLHEAVVGAGSPMIQSPASSRSDRYYSSSQPVSSSHVNGRRSPHSLSQPSHESQRRQIQLNYTPRTPLISAPVSYHN
ncbi:uncharacterized protein [Amphiura filiformis]|uniref:uncharacterized protein n=1 Tax=Amphiura filiformis TaxID=82378 RepID=UPI003B21486E